MPIRDVDAQNSVVPQVLFGEQRGFSSQQVSRNCVAGERVQDEDVVVLRCFVFERQSRVAEYHFRLAFGVLEESEILFGHPNDLGVDLVEAQAVVFLSVRGECTDTQADNSDTTTLSSAVMLHDQTDARFLTVVSGR